MDNNEEGNLVTQYLLALVILTIITTTAIVIIFIVRPDHDNSGIITTIVGLSAPTLLALAAFLRSQANSNEMKAAKIQDAERAKEIKEALEASKLKDEQRAAEIKHALEEKAREVKSAVVEAKEHQDRRLTDQDVKLDTLATQTNGINDALNKAAEQKGFAAGVKSEQDRQ